MFLFLIYARIDKLNIHNNVIGNIVVYKMGFRTFLAQLVSIKVVIRGKYFFKKKIRGTSSQNVLFLRL